MNAILQVENLTKQYADFKLDHVSFSVPKGTIMGLIGENGAGKSTTINAILDLIHKDDGTVTFWGQELSSTKQIKEDVGVVFDGINFYETLTPAKVGKIAGAAYKQWDGHLFQDYLKRFQLPADKEIKSLSKGMKMKLCIAVALSHNPKLLILDEATSGLDPVMRDDILDVFLEFVQDENHSILMSSHITTDLEKVADYITFIHQGKVLFCKTKDELRYNYGIIRCGAALFDQLDKAEILAYRKDDYQWNKERVKMYHAHFRGTHYEAGFRWGSLLLKHKNIILENIPFEITQERIDYALCCLPIYEKYYHEIVEEIQGLADGQQCDVRILQAVLFSMYSMPPSCNCSCFAFTTEQEILLGRNSDFLTEIERLNQNVVYKLTDGVYSFTGNEKEKNELEEEQKDCQQQLDSAEKQADNTNHFIELAKKYTDFSELTPAMVNEFVSKIIVHRPFELNGTRAVQVEVYLNYIGKFDVPEEPMILSEEELATQKIREEKLEKHRIASRKYMAKYRKRLKEMKKAGTILPENLPAETKGEWL